MQKLSEIKKWEIAEFLFIAIAGTLLHFVYEWTGQNPAAAIFAPVNESTWEHLKLLFMPALLFTLIQEIAIGGRYPSLVTEKGKAALLGLGAIPVLFYTYSGILGKNVTWVDILIFYLAAALYTWTSWRNLEQEQGRGNGSLGAAIFVLLFLCFLVFTIRPPGIGLFVSP